MSMLRNLRERKGLTVSQLAAKASISSRVILDYEEGRQTIPLAHAKLLSKALWVGIEELMPPAGSVPPTGMSAPQASPRPTPAPQPATNIQTQASTASAVASPPVQGSPSDTDAPPRYDAPRTIRPVSGDGQASRGGADGTGGAVGGARGARPTRPAPPPPGPITEGQMEELQRLAVKLDITQEQLEERVGKKLSDLNRPEAKDWIKRVRAMAEEIVPSRKVPYGQWPEGREDQEAAYLKSQQEAGSYFIFKLFNGDQFDGTITDYTPYTITLKLHGSDDEMVLRKLAIAYYRRTEAPTQAAVGDAATATAAKATPKPKSKARSKGVEERHQPLDTGLDSDRPGEPDTPETDQMDEDRGA